MTSPNPEGCRSELVVRATTSIDAVPASEWDACANPPMTAEPAADALTAHDPQNPFVSHAFLRACEVSGSATARAGWGPAHLLVEEAGRLVAAAPCYVKTNSQGEYVFDHGWADAYLRAGGRYYPKLQVSVPFTPVNGPRLLVRPGGDEARARGTLIAGLKALRAQAGASSVHITFLPKDDWEELGVHGFLQRTGQQFHWANEGYGSFDDFLAALSSRKRKTIRRERRDALARDISVEWFTGKDITEAHWDAFWAFYQDTGSRKWGRPYLTRRFFSEVGASMAERVLLVMAKRNKRYVAGAINFIGANALYGRNWGCVEDHPFLHFEVCYYQAIEFAITRKLARVEAGAQGEHKLMRGYRPVTTYSAHDIADAGLRRAIEAYLRQERSHIAAANEDLETLTPFRRGARTDEEQDA
jgi:uncharacterized protein